MNTRELLQYEIGQVGKQLEACFNGMSEAAFDTKCSENAMTPREIIVHLAEAYLAFMAVARGEKHNWGSFTVEDKTTSNLLSVFRDIRTKAVEMALASDDEAVSKEAYDYIIGHDNYHVGQLVQSRTLVDLDWDTNAIYG
jgi:hypothetical protein